MFTVASLPDNHSPQAARVKAPCLGDAQHFGAGLTAHDPALFVRDQPGHKAKDELPVVQHALVFHGPIRGIERVCVGGVPAERDKLLREMAASNMNGARAVTARRRIAAMAEAPAAPGVPR